MLSKKRMTVKPKRIAGMAQLDAILARAKTLELTS